MWFNIEVLSLLPACLAPQLLLEQALMMPRQQDLSPAHWGTPRLMDGGGRRVRNISFAWGFGVWGPSPTGFQCGHGCSAVSSPDKEHKGSHGPCAPPRAGSPRHPTAIKVPAQGH